MEEGGRRRKQKGARKQGSRQEGRKEATEGGRTQPAFKKLEAFTWKAGKMRLEI